jgi:hypothetical protein
VQLLPLSWLFIRLARRYGVSFNDSSTLKSVGKLFAPTGENFVTAKLQVPKLLEHMQHMTAVLLSVSLRPRCATHNMFVKSAQK